MSSISETIESVNWSREHQVELANLCHYFAKAFELPANMDIEDAVGLRRIAASLQQPFHACAQTMSTAWDEALRDRRKFDLAYARLFLGPFEIFAPPYASFYLEPDQGLLGKVSQYAERAYADAGLAVPSGPREAPDHIGFEMEFAYFLGFQVATTGDSIWRSRQREFWTEHLVAWLPPFCDAVQQSHVHPFYDALAEFLAKFTRSVYDSFFRES